jgi:predicted metal-dependent enzyme (double-stranded beta helix superfamily)
MDTYTLPPRLRDFVHHLEQAVDGAPAEAPLLARGRALLQALVAHDDWLPEAFARPHPQYYQQYLLHADAAQRFSVVSFVWGPGQGTPIHDHTVWGLIGMLRGAEESQAYAQDAQGRWRPHGPARLLRPGEVEAVSPAIGDVHRVRNALPDGVSISIHVYGADIGRVQRHVFTEEGATKPFVSGYANPTPSPVSPT